MKTKETWQGQSKQRVSHEGLENAAKMENLGKHLHGSLAFTENDVASHMTDLFRPVSQEVSMKESCEMHIRPISDNQQGPFDFTIPPRGDFYIHMNQIRLRVRAKVTLEDGTNIAATDGVGVCNLMGNSLIQSIAIAIKGKNISELENTHANYKAYLETFLSYSPNGGTGPLAASFWNLDEATHFDDVNYFATVDNPLNAAQSKNDGFRARRDQIGVSKLFELVIPLHSDFLNCDRLLPPHIEMQISLKRAPDSFVLMHPASTTKRFKIELSHMKLVVPYVAVADAIMAHHDEMSLTKPALLPIKKTDVYVHHAPAQSSMVQLSNVFPLRLPKTIIIGMVETTAYNGSAQQNPYNFQHFGVNHVNILHNGVVVPSEPYTPDWENGLYVREYRAFFDNTGIGTDNINSNMNPNLFKSGATLFAFDLTPDRCNSFHWHKQEKGTIGIDFRFKAPLAKGVTFLMFGVYDACVGIDRGDNVLVSY